MIITRRSLLTASAGGVAFVAFGNGLSWAAELPKLKKKDKYKVGFAQTESNNPWRLAQTASMKDEAAKRGWQLVYTDAAGSAAKQVADVRSMIAQKVDVIFLAPREEKPLVPAVMEAKNAGIPLFCIDRSVDASMAKAGRDYVAFIGSDFVKEGQMCGRSLRQGGGRQGQDHRTAGHHRLLAGERPHEGLQGRHRQISRTCRSSPPSRATSPATRAARCSRPCIRRTRTRRRSTGHNDEMTMGAIAAMEAAGKMPGKDLDDRLDRRHQGRRPGGGRRQDRGPGRVQPALRPAGLPGRSSIMRPARRSPSGWSTRTGSSPRTTSRPICPRRSESCERRPTGRRVLLASYRMFDEACPQ